MPDDNKVVISIETETKEALGGVKDLSKSLKDFVKKTEKTNKELVKSFEKLVGALEGISDGYKDVGEAAEKSGKKQQKSQQKVNEELKKTESFIKKIGSAISKAGKYDVGRGFFGGLARGSGIAGIYNTFRQGQRRERFGSALGRGLTGGASMLGGFFMGGMQQAYGTAMQYGQARYGMTGLGRPGDLRRARAAYGRAGGANLGFSAIETAMMAPGAAASTGNLGSVRLAQQLAIGGGFGPGRIGEAMGFMGTMRQAGQSFTGQENQKAAQKDLSKMVAAGMFSGLEKARLPEFFGSVRGLVQSQFASSAGKVDSISIAKQLAELGRRGGAAFQGERGARIMGQLDAMIRRPGGGEAGQAMILQAMGFGKPGGGTNYYDAMKMQQKGIRDPKNVKRVMEEVYKQHGTVAAGGADPRNREANIVFSTLSGLSLEIVEKLKDIHSSNISDEKKQEEIKKVLKEAEPIDKQALRVSKEGFAGIKKHLSGVEGKMIALGNKILPEMLKLQNLQMNVLSTLSKGLPTIIEGIKKIYETMVAIAGWVKGVDPASAVREISNRLDKTIENVEKRKPKSFQGFLKQQKDLIKFSENYSKDIIDKSFGTGIMGKIKGDFARITGADVGINLRLQKHEATAAYAKRSLSQLQNFIEAANKLEVKEYITPEELETVKRAGAGAVTHSQRQGVAKLKEKILKKAKQRKQIKEKSGASISYKLSDVGDTSIVVQQNKVIPGNARIISGHPKAKIGGSRNSGAGSTNGQQQDTSGAN